MNYIFTRVISVLEGSAFSYVPYGGALPADAVQEFPWPEPPALSPPAEDLSTQAIVDESMIGEQVFFYWKDEPMPPRWYRARLVKQNDDGSYEAHYEDGTVDKQEFLTGPLARAWSMRTSIRFLPPELPNPDHHGQWPVAEDEFQSLISQPDLLNHPPTGQGIPYPGLVDLHAPVVPVAVPGALPAADPAVVRRSVAGRAGRTALRRRRRRSPRSRTTAPATRRGSSRTPAL